MQKEVIDRLTDLENTIARYDDVISDEASDLYKECGIISADNMRIQLSSLEKENRLLNIGIIGRVKAGKSSLLNSVFFEGKSILPKAATPMTASLTVMTHGDAFSATVEYFSSEDIKNIEREHNAYQAEWDKNYDAKKKEAEKKAKERDGKADLDKVKRSTDAAMKNTLKYAFYDHYEQIKKSGVKAPVEANQNLDANSLSELMGELDEYVGSKGKMMPYTKSVEIRFPEDALRDICVVDTPGINDPVKSREARTEEYLKKCDVVFIVSSAGQFISNEDMELMDRLSAKEGIRELYLVASQADNQVHGSIKDEARQDLNKAVKAIQTDLSSQALSNLSELKRNHPEIAGQFDQLIKGGQERVMVTSAICHAMRVRFDDQNSWDSDMNHVWGLLCKDYPDHFGSDASAKASLELLSGIKKVSEKIKFAKSKKDEIIAQKQADYVTDQAKNINRFSKMLVEAVKAKIDRVNNADIASIRKQKEDVKKLFSKGTDAVDGTYDDCVNKFKKNILNKILNESRTLFQEAGNKNKNEEESHTETWTTGWWFWKKYHSVEVRTLRTGNVGSTLDDLVENLNNILKYTVDEAKTDWRKEVQSKVIGALIEAVGDDPDLIDSGALKTALRQVVNNMELPNLDLGSNTFSSSYIGTIKDDDIEMFWYEVQCFMSNLKKIFNKARDKFISDMEKSAKRENMSGMIFSNLKKQLESLEKDIKNKEQTLNRLKKCLSELKKAV
jgi:hypothetical protein